MTSAKHVSEDFIILFHPSARIAPDTGKTFSGMVTSEKPTDGGIHIKTNSGHTIFRELVGKDLEQEKTTDSRKEVKKKRR